MDHNFSSKGDRMDHQNRQAPTCPCHALYGAVAIAALAVNAALADLRAQLPRGAELLTVERWRADIEAILAATAAAERRGCLRHTFRPDPSGRAAWDQD
jgi:hypothetical protein